MTYADAFKIGSKVEGYIKCKYAEIHSPEFGLLFSLHNTIWAKLSAAKATGLNIGIGSATDGEFAIHSGDLQEVYVPIVEADEFVGADEKIVPVTLTKLAFNYIKKQLSQRNPNGKNVHTHVTLYTLWKVWDKVPQSEYGKVSVGSRIKVYESYYEPAKMDQYKDTEYYHYVQKYELVPNPRMELFKQQGSENSVFYVKQVAIDWYPTNIENATIVLNTEDGGEAEINLNDAIAQAEEKVKQAKAILAAAGAMAII